MAENDNRHDVRRYWDGQQPVFERIYSIGMESYATSLPRLEQAFHPMDRCLRCIDEGTPGYHFAGSGMLRGSRGIEDSLKKVDIDGIYSHEGCGAAVRYANMHGLDSSRANEFARQ